ncbi:MAG: LysR family transcriptional regulator [Burkholderiales bacterium]|nr:LysR family transcriptional regulator [Burkholderiales bacterium]
MIAPAPTSLDLLPLHELAAFEAAARLGSLARAAEELNVTGSALSHRLSSLQARLGVVLFERKGKGIVITPDGTRYLGSLRGVLHSLRSQGDALREREHEVVRLVVAPAIATAWLLPHLAGLLASDPGLRLDVTTAALPDDATGLDFDLLVHYGAGEIEGTERTVLFADSVLPLCAPSLMPANSTSLDREAFARLPLLRHTLSWSRWIEGAFGEHAEVEAHAYFDDATTMLEAAASGAGIALGTGIASMPYLADGSLVAAHPYRLPDRDYCAGLSESGRLKPRARALVSWLAGIAAARLPAA